MKRYKFEKLLVIAMAATRVFEREGKLLFIITCI
jgi:hypothetical protein